MEANVSRRQNSSLVMRQCFEQDRPQGRINQLFECIEAQVRRIA